MKALKFSSLAVVVVAVGSILAGCASDTRDDLEMEGTSEDSLIASPITDEDIADPSQADDSADVTLEEESLLDQAQELDTAAVAQSANGAINWYKNRTGNTSYEGYCEKAARLSWARKTRHPSAIEHWRSGDGARHSGKAPKGAFVFWNTSKYGHVAVADGVGGAWSTSVGRKIGHIKSTSYFRNYLGWKPGNSN